jgi:16S rRNA (uracil1498-N3)-methyltransferase
MDKYEHFIFFVDEILGDKALFPKEEITHALSVLRMDSRGGLQATDGRGNIYECSIAPESAVTGEVQIVTSRAMPRLAPELYVFIALPDRDAFESVVTDLSAMGAAKIVPVVSRYCQNAWWERWEKYADRFKRKMIAGIKQSHNPWLPDMSGPVLFTHALTELGSFDNSHCIVADQSGVPLNSIRTVLTDVAKVACIIGPPGGFSQEETDCFRSNGFVFVNIAPYRLRTELAAVVLCGNIIQAQTVRNN